MTNTEVTVWGPNVRFPDEVTFHVHAANCADLSRGVYRYLSKDRDQGGWTIEADSIQSIVEDVYVHQIEESNSTWDDPSYVGDFHFFPCLDHLSYARPTEAREGARNA